MYFFPIPARYKNGLFSFFLLSILLFLAIIMIVFPQNIFPAAKRGLETWWSVVLPGLLPFFVMSELFLQFGVVHFLSVFLEPIMRPLFNIPGSAALILATGYTSGAPIGGILTSRLRQQNLINQEEAGRLIAFTNNASPLFMLSAIAIGFLGQPEIGWILASSHYIANLCIGVLFKYFSPAQGISSTRHSLGQLFLLGLEKMHRAYHTSAKPFGQILGDAIKNSMQTMFVVGGFIIIFSVLIEILSVIGFLNIIAQVIGILLIPLGFDPTLLLPLASGLLEMTIGIKMISESNAPFLQQLVCISLLLGWAGTAIHAQVVALVSDSNIGLTPYFLARILQGLLAASFTYIIGYRLLPTISVNVISPPLATWSLALGSLKLMLFLLVCFLIINILYLIFQGLVNYNK